MFIDVASTEKLNRVVVNIEGRLKQQQELWTNLKRQVLVELRDQRLETAQLRGANVVQYQGMH